jgi:crotonobetainyl-CoA:carnitine CoA-transferase CaiB-like acyl-CoA transferase
MGREELATDPRFDTPKKRATNSVQVDEIVGVFAAKYKREDLFKLLFENQVPCAPVRDLAEITNDPHLHQRGMLEWMNHPKYGRIAAARSPLRFGGQGLNQLVPSAELGAHNQEVYGDWLGIPSDELERLQKEGVI